jgi:type II secretory pathway pseudopilin PulG
MILLNQMKKINLKNKNSGYTIIETMIAVSVFLVVVMTGMGALLNANFLHKKSANTRSIMDNLSFIMEDMSRNLRTGSNYHCIDDGDLEDVENPHSCILGGGIAFKDSYGESWIYYIGNDLDNNPPTAIWKSVNGEPFVKLNASEIEINNISGFYVLGAEAPESGGNGDAQQPFVTIRLSGEIIYKDNATPFALQTSVSQRLVDVFVPPVVPTP